MLPVDNQPVRNVQQPLGVLTLCPMLANKDDCRRFEGENYELIKMVRKLLI